MTAARALMRLMSWASLQRRVSLFLLMVLAGVSEGLGVLLLVPLLSALQGDVGGGESMVARAATQAITAFDLRATASVPWLLLSFCTLLLLRNTVQHARECAAARLQQDVAERLREASFSALLDAQWRWLQAQRTSDHSSLMLSNASRVGVGLGHGLAMLASFATAAIYVLAGFALDWKLALTSTLGGALLLALLAGQRRGVLTLGRQLTVSSQRLHASLQDSLAGLRLAKILGAEARYAAWIARDASALRDQHLRFASALSFSKALLHSAGAVLLAAYIYLGLRVWQVPVAELLTLVLVFARLLPLLAATHQQHQYWLHALPAFTDMDRQISQARAWAEPDAAQPVAQLQMRRSITLRAVSVRYADRTAPALNSVSLTFPVHTTTAIIGASGAGKSTLADVLCGLLGPDEGSLAIDDVPLDGQMRRSWRQAVAYVSQDTFLFNDTIHHNLRIAAPQADDAMLRAALEKASAGFVHALPQGWDTIVGERGVRLSGGERQRLALARALLQRPALLILDEATSALDHDNESRIHAAIEQLHGQLTVVVIGHRLGLLERADQVILLEQGRVRAQGRWHEVSPAWTEGP